ncbi:unnamed protein product [Penicillium salamii]|uniref:YCII-related domain-containing protein n=1 Tax=Penicillium salamii TaxID=1612424 RepID=A0A9W4NWH7_9EURO|nr:unnamed protein product [Penicillium salamii]CAG7956193.1 unnamed protein product [Penicillium salamii]CAG8188751.1 unnamed protein product [Penicillium salamii]CAG8192792.1 unnamed protein product [Penicillium salamii]CAG8225858.1 unnamed protein product [Penicillium salamii]
MFKSVTRLSKVPAFPHQSLPVSVSTFQFHHFTSQSYKMSKEFLCILPDKPGVHAKRMEVRPSHLEGVKPHVASGAIVAGGAMLNAHPAEGETPSFKGSMMMVVAESAEKALELLKKDIYTVSGVWDLENAQIIPVCLLGLGLGLGLWMLADVLFSINLLCGRLCRWDLGLSFASMSTRIHGFDIN